MKSFPSSPRAGSALILVLWGLLLLGMAVFGVVELVELSVQHTSHEESALDARGMALSGVALGLNPQLLKDDPLLVQKAPNGHQFKVGIASEGARMNLNYVLISNHREILVNLFVQWGLQTDQADHVADCMYDWVTPGDLKSLNGAKAEDYERANLPQRPSYKQFQSLDEVDLVMGMDLIDKARNVNEAPPDLIAAVFGLDPKRVSFFTDARNGRDGIPGTADDVPVPSATNLEGQLGVGDLAMKALSNEISFKDPNRRVESVGQADGTQVMISVVTRLNTSPIQYLLWSEQ
jgi:hypothetical protein